MRKLFGLLATLLIPATAFGAAGGGSAGGGGGLRTNPFTIDHSRLRPVAEMTLGSSYTSSDGFTGKIAAFAAGGDAIGGGSGGFVLEDGTMVTIVGRHHGEFVIRVEFPDGSLEKIGLRREELPSE